MVVVLSSLFIKIFFHEFFENLAGVTHATTIFIMRTFPVITSMFFHNLTSFWLIVGPVPTPPPWLLPAWVTTLSGYLLSIVYRIILDLSRGLEKFSQSFFARVGGG